MSEPTAEDKRAQRITEAARIKERISLKKREQADLRAVLCVEVARDGDRQYYLKSSGGPVAAREANVLIDAEMIETNEWTLPLPEGDWRRERLSRSHFIRCLRMIAIDQLQAGGLIARGFTQDRLATGKAVIVSADRWHVLRIDFDNGLAKAADGETVFYGITVERAAADAAQQKGRRTSPKASELRKWQAAYEAQQGDAIPSKQDHVAAARRHFGAAKVTQRLIWALRPQHWERPAGRPRKSAK